MLYLQVPAEAEPLEPYQPCRLGSSSHGELGVLEEVEEMDTLASVGQARQEMDGQADAGNKLILVLCG